MTRRYDEPALTAMLQYFGREVALAYNVLNTTNYWAIALVGGLITALLVDGNYPTVPRWSIVTISLVFLNRFFVRSYLPYVNLWRWNMLIDITLETLDKNGPKELNLARLDTALTLYHHRFCSPKPVVPMLWASLKLTYLWLYVLLLSLFVWGWIGLDTTITMWSVSAFLMLTVILEVYWFVSNPLFRYEPMPKELVEVAPAEETEQA